MREVEKTKGRERETDKKTKMGFLSSFLYFPLDVKRLV